jgi:hypothetical protein
VFKNSNDRCGIETYGKVLTTSVVPSGCVWVVVLKTSVPGAEGLVPVKEPPYKAKGNEKLISICSGKNVEASCRSS